MRILPNSALHRKAFRMGKNTSIPLADSPATGSMSRLYENAPNLSAIVNEHD